MGTARLVRAAKQIFDGRATEKDFKALAEAICEMDRSWRPPDWARREPPTLEEHVADGCDTPGACAKRFEPEVIR